MPVEFSGTGMSPAQKQRVNRLKEIESEEEDRKRRQLLDAELGEVRQRLTPDQYEELLDRQRNYTDMNRVNQTLQWHEISRLASEKGTEDAVNKANELLGKEGREYLNSIGPRTGPANQQELNAIINSPSYRKNLQKQNEVAGKAQGREFEFVDKVAGYEDRASTYAEGLAAALKAGIYPGGGKFDDYVFDDDVFRRRWADSRRMDKWQLESHAKALKGEITNFEQTRQKLTENYQRMDPFARTQYKEMEKKVKGLERARQEGRLRPLEYLRHMASLADAAKTIRWDFHMKAPGGEVGDIFDKDGNGGFYQRMPDGKLEMVSMSPEYFNSKVQKLDEGVWLIPTIDKDGREVMKEIKGGRPGVDWKEKQEYLGKLEKLEEEYIKEALSDDPDQTHEEAREWAHQMALKRLGEYKSAADKFADPDEENPDADPAAYMQAKTEAEKQIAYEQGQLAAKERAMQTFAAQRAERRELAEALAPVVDVIDNRGKSFKTAMEAVKMEQYNQELERWAQENQASFEWTERVGRGEQLGPPPPYTRPKPKKPGRTYGPERELKQTYGKIIENAESNEELRHFLAMEGEQNMAVKYLLENPIPVKPDAMKRGEYLKDGFVYSRINNVGITELFLKHKGKWFPLGPQDLNAGEKPITEDRGMFGNMIDHGNEAANVAAGGNL